MTFDGTYFCMTPAFCDDPHQGKLQEKAGTEAREPAPLKERQIALWFSWLSATPLAPNPGSERV